MKQLFILIAVVLFFSACEEVVKLDLQEGDVKLVVEGSITTESVPEVILSNSTAYYENESNYISDALVIISDDNSLLDTLKEDASQKGRYISTKTYTGEIGRTYKLQILHNNKIYEAEDYLAKVGEIDSINIKVCGNKLREDFFVYLFAKESPELGQYYMWKTFVNGKNISKLEYLSIETDEQINGKQINNVPIYSDLFYDEELIEGGEEIYIKQYSISKQAYRFLYKLSEQVGGGGMFDTPVSNVKGNISGDALGFFMANDVKTSETRIANKNIKCGDLK